MLNKRTRTLALSAAGLLTLSLGLAACGGGGSDDSESKGLIISTEDPIDHLDPQRIYTGRDLAQLNRLVYRQLVSFPSTGDDSTPVPDLATDTGTSKKGGREWSFTLKDGVKWEDGSDITCEDLKYGASRNFAAEQLTGGPGFYLTQKLDIPASAGYAGPYSDKGAAAFDKAIVCDGKTITYKFNSPWADFPLAVASLHMMDPYKESEDKGAKNDDFIFSNGPYKVEGEVSTKTGFKLVRNDEYDPATDSEELREANPESVEFTYGDPAETTYEQLFNDAGDAAYTITNDRLPPSLYSRIPEAEDRYVSVESPYVDYLVPNQNQITNPDVRKALAMATNVNGWIAAGGGEKSYIPADSIVNPVVNGYEPNPAFADRNMDGDIAEAKKLLAQSGEATPYPIKFSYPQSDTADKQAAAIADTWNKAGFKVQLDPLGDEYYSKIQKPGNDADVIWGGWGADWPSAITVTAPLFDGRQINAGSNGQNYGNYQSDKTNGLFDKASAATSLDEQTKFLQQADAQLGADVAYIPLEIQIFNWMYGSKVTGFSTSGASSSFPEIGSIDVE